MVINLFSLAISRAKLVINFSFVIRLFKMFINWPKLVIYRSNFIFSWIKLFVSLYNLSISRLGLVISWFEMVIIWLNCGQ